MLFSITEKSKYYDFKTFNLGITLKPSVLERDDYLKSKFKIQGIENIKFSLAKELSKKISRKTHSKRITDDFELFIQANFKNESCVLRTKPLFVYGRYTKKIRSISQKQKKCEYCAGLGCHNCNFKGLKNLETIEGIISNLLIKKFDGTQVKINWIGGENKSSLVLGNGRPFFAKIINPKKRNRRLPKFFDSHEISIIELQKIPLQPKGSIPFKSEVSITVNTEKPISLSQLKKLKTIENSVIKDSSKNKKNLEKRVYHIEYDKVGKNLATQNQFVLDLFADGGIPLKSFIQNSDITPNISDLIKNRCECVTFDFKNILV